MQNYKKTMKITLVFPPRSIQCFLLPFSVVPSRLFSLPINTFTSYCIRTASCCKSCLVLVLSHLTKAPPHSLVAVNTQPPHHWPWPPSAPLSRLGHDVSHLSPTQGHWVGVVFSVTKNAAVAILDRESWCTSLIISRGDIPTGGRAESRDMCCKGFWV